MNTFIKRLVIAIAVVFIIAAAGYAIKRGGGVVRPGPGGEPVQKQKDEGKVTKFSSDQEFGEYLAKASQMGASGYGFGGGMALRTRGIAESSLGAPVTDSFGTKAEAPSGPDRVSGTNVQVIGIDEPDIVKTDGKEIYVSTPGGYPVYYEKMVPIEPRGTVEELNPPFDDMDIPSRPTIVPPYPDYNRGGVKAVKAFPPADLKIDATIEETGDLLLSGSTLVAFPGSKIVGYDVSDPSKPEKKWTINIENNTSIVTSRLKDGKIYLVTQTGVYSGIPCPIRPLAVGDEKIAIPCTEIYHPVRPVPTDTTFSVMVIDPASGAVEKKTAFVGNAGRSTIYMSFEAVYVTYSYEGDFIGYVVGFFKENRDIVPAEVTSKLEKLQSYDLSDAAKMAEFGVIMQKFEQNLEGDDRMKLENEFANRMQSYHKAHKRDLERTGIVKISTDDLSVDASGVVPGRLLNQFALDEFEGNLRVAVTVGENSGWWGFGRGGNRDSANDVYVLNKDLETVGSIADMGLTERIYSVRFIKDKGYVVTFRQTDPFYVLNLANPRAPKLEGELKIPGYSSYLHPISENRILGVGQEGSRVKLSLFNVASAQNPSEADKYLLSEGWSEVASTHHAFLQDEKHKVFFLPGGQGGYIFSYSDDKLSLTKAISGVRARRALFINDYFYIVGDDKIVVLNEKDWERVNEVSL